MPDLLMPLVTGLFLVFAGMLFARLLWYRDRSQGEAIVEELRAENQTLQIALQSSEDKAKQSAHDLTVRESKFHILEALCDDFAAEREKSQSLRIDLESEIRVQRNQIEQLDQQRETEKRQRLGLSDQLHELQIAHREQLSTVEEAQRESTRRLETDLAARQADVWHLSENSDRVTAELHDSRTQYAALQTELECQQQMLATATANASGLEKEYVSIESTLRSHHQLLQESRGQIASADSARAIAEQALCDMRGQLDDQQIQLEELRSQRNDHEKVQRQCNELRESIAAYQHRIEIMTHRQSEQLADDERSRSRVAGFVARLENQESTIRVMRSQIEQHVLHAHKENEAQLMIDDARQELIGKLRSELQQRWQESESAKIINEELRCQLHQTAQQQEQAVAAAERLEQDLLTRIAESEEFTKQIVQAKSEHTKLIKSFEIRESTNSQQLTKLRLRMEQLQQENMQHQARLTTLNRERNQLHSELLKTNEALQENEQLLAMQVAEVSTRLQLTSGQRDQAFDQVNELRVECDGYQSELEAQNEVIGNLKNSQSGPVAIAFTQDQDDPIHGGRTRLDPRRGRIYTQPPTIRDDLKLISGIAQVLERRLNEFGVYTYQQILEWDETAIEEYSTLLTFKDRIERDNWIGQARQLFEQTERRAA